MPSRLIALVFFLNLKIKKHKQIKSEISNIECTIIIPKIADSTDPI